MTSQEIFDTVLSHLREQGKAARGANGNCAYRGYGGTACAVGCLIPDSLYDPQIEGMGVGQILEKTAPVLRDRPTDDLTLAVDRITNHLGAEHLELLKQLQKAHDMELLMLGLGVWEDSMRQLARQFDLQYAPPAGVSEADQ